MPTDLGASVAIANDNILASKQVSTSVCDAESFRIYDADGWPEIKENPITKVGIFQYSGSQISDALDPNQIFNVYRPAEELSRPETIESFKYKPLINEHAMLGSSKKGLTPAEEKGIEGVIGHDVKFDPKSGMLVGNLKIYSESMSEAIDQDGKKELSAGYYCDFVPEKGIYDGESYDFVQRNINGNHLALVWEGRSGPDVAVRDHMKFTCDTKELIMPDKEVKDVIVLDADESKTETQKEDKKAEDEANPDMFVRKEEVTDSDEEDDKKDSKKAEDSDEDKDDDKDKKSSGMDEAVIRKNMFVEFAQRNALSEKLSNHIGTFDHAEMTLDEVAKYGVAKIAGRKSVKDSMSFLEGYFLGAQARISEPAKFAEDSKIESNCVDKFITGSK